MNRFPGHALCAAAVLALAGAGWGAFAAEPSVPYVPTPQEVVERMLEMAKVGPQDYLVDLGSGDGRIVVTAAKKYGARGFGVDLNPVRIKESVENAAKAGVSDRVAFHERNLFETDLSDASVITMYLLPSVNLELRPKLLELKPGTRLVSHDFSMDDWKPDEFVEMYVKEKYGSAGGNSSVYFWIVPARVAGAWQWRLTIGGKPQAYELALDQKFQMISGMVRVGGRSVKLQDAKLRGDQISFSFSTEVNGSPLKHQFSGRVAGNSIDGAVSLAGSRTQGQLEWNATRGAKTGYSPGAARLAAAIHQEFIGLGSDKLL
ncbi:MAG: class I SAM-dependent methyltransferase [Betaproteobacteria bacterium]|nr:class I SAM-dependent methyltransferase [Betaproteobacteria bacterium]